MIEIVWIVGFVGRDRVLTGDSLSMDSMDSR